MISICRSNKKSPISNNKGAFSAPFIKYDFTEIVINERK